MVSLNILEKRTRGAWLHTSYDHVKRRSKSDLIMPLSVEVMVKFIKEPEYWKDLNE